jgi:threonyl-tRNA synthetase
MLIVGEREANEGMVAIRKHGQGDQGSVAVGEFVEKFKKECAAPGI